MSEKIAAIINRIANIDLDALGDCCWHYPAGCKTDILSEEDVSNHKYAMWQNGEEGQIYIYIHIPFCISFCIFCPYKNYIFDKNKIAEYLSALKAEIALYGKTKYLSSKKVVGIYLGGGTPNLLRTEEILEILNYCRRHFKLSDDIEIALEAAPFALSDKKLTDLFKGGINRLSLGIQTFNDKIRKFCKIRASAKEAYDIINLAHDVGFKNINADLVCNLPGQALEDFRRDLKTAVGLKVENLSCYVLAVCQGTELYDMAKNGVVKSANNHLATRMYIFNSDMLRNSGYRRIHLTGHYALGENSFSVYYSNRLKNHDEYVGFGAGAGSLLNGYSYKNVLSLKRYYEKTSKGVFPIYYGLKMDTDMRIRGAAVSELGTGALERDRFVERFGVDPLNYFSDAIRELECKKMVTIDDKKNIVVSYIGQFYWSYVCAHLFSKEILEKIYNTVTKQNA